MIWRSLLKLPHMKILKDCNYAFPQLWIGVLGTVCLWILSSAQVVHFSSNKVSSHQFTFYLSIQIPAVLITKDLGVHFSSTVTWTLQHISAISVTRPMKCLGIYLDFPEVLKAQLLFNPPPPTTAPSYDNLWNMPVPLSPLMRRLDWRPCNSASIVWSESGLAMVS